MKKTTTLWAAGLVLALALTGCGAQQPNHPASIPFEEDQLYAVAYLGYGARPDLTFYEETYLDGVTPPTHHLSPGEYYLVIPRYADMDLSLSQNDIETQEAALLYEEPSCRPFLLECNASDIFADAVITFTRQGESVTFTPFLSLKDGSVEIGPQGLDLTQ